MPTHRLTTLVVWGGLVALAGTCGAEPQQQDTSGEAISYRFEELASPRTLRVHALRVDLSDPGIEAAVVVADDPDGDGPAEAALTNPFELADDPAVLAFINTNPWDSFPDAHGRKNRSWFEGQPVDISGLAAVAGEVRSSEEGRGAPVWFDEAGAMVLDPPTADSDVAAGTSGFARVLVDGRITVEFIVEDLNPRTAIGTNKDGTVAWLVVVDGRQPGVSEGVNLHELAQIMLDLGCWQATNMDGGGSSIMAMTDEEGELRVVNTPSGRRDGEVAIRPLPMVLTIRKRESSQ